MASIRVTRLGFAKIAKKLEKSQKLSKNVKILENQRRFLCALHTVRKLMRFLKNMAKLFQPNYNNLDAKVWVQKLVLKKYLKKN